MENAIRNFFNFSFTVLLLCGCNFSSPEEINVIDETSNKLEIPTGFDFSTHHEVTINIIDNLNYAKYDVYAYSEELYDAGTETFENESGETVTETVYKSDVLDKLIFSGVPRNGVLKQTINLPKFYNKVYIRRS